MRRSDVYVLRWKIILMCTAAGAETYIVVLSQSNLWEPIGYCR
jgi:hypothetical protein